MAARETTYWIGKGVVKIGDAKYKSGDEIPTEKVNAKTLEKWREEKKVSNVPVAIKETAGDTKDKARIKELETELAKLKTAKVRGKACKKCPEKDTKIKEQAGKIEELETDVKEKAALIEKLTADLEAATKPDSEGGEK
jgi:hypothetical protein